MRRSVFLALCMYFILGIDATCYFPNGTAQSSGDQYPCNTASGVESMCCNIGNTSTPGRCNQDGLCIPYNNGHLWRGTCTDPTWKDPACLHVCTVGQGLNGLYYAAIDAGLITCADGTWCCDLDDASACCAGGKGVAIIDGKVVTPQQPVPHAATSSSLPSLSATAAETLSQSPSPSPFKEATATSSPSIAATAISSPSMAATATPPPKTVFTNTGITVGGAVGGCAGVIALAFILWHFIRRKIKQGTHHESNQINVKGIWQDPEELPTLEARVELGSRQARQELEDRALHELRIRESSIGRPF